MADQRRIIAEETGKPADQTPQLWALYKEGQDYFLDYAWNPDRIGADQLDDYSRQWATRQFGPKYAAGIADILAKYAKYNARRRPELLDADTYSLTTGEWATGVADYNQLLTQAEKINQQLSAEYRDAYYQLVLHPVQTGTNLNELFFTVAQNRAAAKAGKSTTNWLADNARVLLAKDGEIKNRYHALAGGKWNRMMDQTHIGYTYWQPPLADKMPEVMTLPADKITAVAEPSLPRPFSYTNSQLVSIEAEHYSQAVNTGPVRWQRLPDLGRTAGAVTTFPVTAVPTANPGGASPHLECRITLAQAGPVTVQAYLAPTLDFIGQQGLRYAVSFDDEAPQIINLHTGMVADNGNKPWEKAVAENIILKESKHTLARPGAHVLKFWRVDPGVVLEKLVIDLGGVKPSYLGPPESASGSRGPKAAAAKGSVGQG